jgi:lipopolysaccharide/colanic/teichoic acid biosynthesis glycosyltransferase
MKLTVKRGMDIVLAGTGLLVLAPVMLGVALAIRLVMGQPVLYRQLRPGHHAQPFQIVKFRTMRGELDAEGRPLPADKRITPLGQLLRRTSLDEMPELWNILKGEMSLVGPRPLLMEYLPHYTLEQARRHDVTPGLTGLAQVSGRQLLGFDDRFELDVWYVDHWSLRLDLQILAQTVRKVVKGEGVPPITHIYNYLGDPPEHAAEGPTEEPG